MDFCTGRKRFVRLVLPIVILAGSILLGGCLPICAAHIRITHVKNVNDTANSVQESLRLLGWSESERRMEVCKKEGLRHCGTPFESSLPAMDKYGVTLEATEDSTLDITFAIVGTESFSEDAVFAYRELARKMLKKFGSSVEFDRETNHGQVLF